MKRKNLLAFSMAAAMFLSMTACGSETANDSTEDLPETSKVVSENNEAVGNEEAPESLTIEHLYGSTEVPYAPERVCVLGTNVLDFMHTLELSDYVTTIQSAKGMPEYLAEYYESDSIIVLQKSKDHNHSDEKSGSNAEGENKDKENAESGDRESSKAEGENRDSANAEAAAEETDPYEMYYSIDADIIIGSADVVDEEMYAVLEQLAPTIVLGYAMDNENGMYEGIKENARTVASIWGAEEKLDEVVAEYDAVYQQLDEKLEGMRIVMLSSSVDTNRIQVTSSESGKEDNKLETERNGAMLRDLGVQMLADEASEEVLTASVYDRNAEEDAQSEKNKVIAAWIEEVSPDCVLLVDRSFDDIEAARAEGYVCAELDGLTVMKDGKVYQMSYSGKNGANGLTGTFIQLDELKSFFLG